VSRTGRNIISIKGDEFAGFPVNSIDELLRYLPGVEVQMRGPMGAQSDIVMRGGTFQQVLVILDGVRLNDPNTGHFNSYIPIAPTEIDRIEILKGASSAIYGSEAVGGVINIITKTFASRPNQKKTRLSAEGMAGEYHLANANVGGFYQNNNTSVGGGWLSNNTEGQMQRGTRGFVYANTASLSLSHFINEKWQVAVRSSFDNRRFSAQNFYTTFGSDTASEKVQTIWNQARISYSGNKHRVNIDAGWKAVQDDFLFNKVSIANKNKSKQLQATISDEWKVGSSTTLVNGIQIINKTIRSNDRGNHNLAQAAAFFIVSHTIKEWTFNPALRIDWNERSGTELVPQINISWKKNQFQVRGSAGKTIRDADFTERYNNYNKPVVASGRIGDPNLEAEHSFSYEAGVDHFTKGNVKISATFFQRFHKRLIDYTPTPYANMPRKDNLVVGGTYALAKNIARVTTTGAEVDIQFQKNFSSNSYLYGGAGAVWLDSKSSDAVPSFYISSHAKFLFNYFGEYTYKRFFAGINGIYKTRTAQSAAAIQKTISKDYFVINAKAGAWVVKKRIKSFIQINNITNVSYSDLLGSEMPGRWFIAGVSLNVY
ncbi:MAG: TonB-dependent receptor plug domain-containing protein, partial [Chitinophagaceae bacterium]